MKEAKHRGGIKPESKHGELPLKEPSASEIASRAKQQRSVSVAGTVCTAVCTVSKLKYFIQ